MSTPIPVLYLCECMTPDVCRLQRRCHASGRTAVVEADISTELAKLNGRVVALERSLETARAEFTLHLQSGSGGNHPHLVD